MEVIMKNPWDNPAAQDEHNQQVWLMLDELFDFYQARRYKERGWGYKSAAKHFGWTGSPKSLEHAFKYIRSHGDPRENSEWINFKIEYITREDG